MAKDDLKVKLAELSTEVRFMGKAVTEQGQVMKEFVEGIKKPMEGLREDVQALKIWQAEVIQKEKTNVSWWLKVEYYIAMAIGGLAAWLGKMLGIAKVIQ